MSNSANPAYIETANRLTILMQSGLSCGFQDTQRFGELETDHGRITRREWVPGGAFRRTVSSLIPDERVGV